MHNQTVPFLFHSPSRRQRIVWGILLCAGLCIAGLVRGADPAAAFYLEPARIVAWWELGDSARFRLGGAKLPDEIAAVEGVVTDLAGKEVGRVKVDRVQLLADGWAWKPTEPGYYEVEFSSLDAKGQRNVIGRDLHIKAPNGSSRDFPRTTQGLAIVPKASAPARSVGQFGFTCDGPDATQLVLAKLIGFDLVRLLIPWGANFTDTTKGIEATKGTYRWEAMDAGVDLFTRAGFTINGQFLNTPLWASPHPEKTNINICVIEGATYAPKDMGDFARFVEAVVSRYKDRIHLWEIWNEPSIPGGSVFWADTPENFVELLKTGYTAVKKVQPEGQVWIGGLGPRTPYHAFYNRVLQLGGGKYFDVLSLHGAFNTPADKFRDIEISNKVAPKPAVEGEWHAILQGNMQTEPVLSEAALSFKMMKDLLYQLKHGVTRTMLFEMVNLSEKETLSYAIENKQFTHSSGLFRRKPQLEPRQAAVVMANFLDVTGRQASFGKEFGVSDDASALQLATARGPLMVFWSENIPLDLSRIKPFATRDSALKDWEGKSLPLDQTGPLDNGKFYYLTAVKTEAIAKAAGTDKLVSPRLLARGPGKVPGSVFHDGSLFTSADAPANVPENAWIKADWKRTKLLESPQDTEFAARAAFGVHVEALDVVVEVHDATHCQQEPPPSWWNGDSLQLAIDCEGTGFAGGNTELISALTERGPVVWKITAADPHGDIPARWSPGNHAAEFVNQKITRENGVTRYQMRIPWSELYPLTGDPTKRLRVAVAVNNNDGSGRAEYLEWAGGITRDKDPALYGILKAAPAK